MKSVKLNPGWRLGTIFLVGISLSIGWGIRGNTGHCGAEFAGCLAAITVAALSGREDWRNRIPYFAFFGALGWGFGATQSYMQVLSYTDSGHALSQWYGYMAIFYIGFLYVGLGATGTAFAAVASRERMVNLFKPILFVFGAWLFLDLIEEPLAHLLQSATFDTNALRHNNPLYWFDSHYMETLFAFIGVAAYDLYERKGVFDRLLLPVFAAVGALSGWVIQLLLSAAGLTDKLASLLTYQLGDPSYLNPATGLPAYKASDLLNNWPQWFSDYPQHLGWFLGLILGILIYFLLYGKFRNGASLITYMCSGWYIAFLALPVLGSLFFVHYGGIRMTPPRSDNWAGVTGLFIGTSLWMWRNNLRPVAVASLISGTIGGLGFAGVQWIRQILVSFGNPRILEYKGVLPGSEEFKSIASSWARWQGQNWHSFLEQGYGFVNGVAIAVTLAFLASRIKLHTDEKDSGGQSKGRWTRAFSALFVMLVLTYYNVLKNVEFWSDHLNPDIWKRIIPHAGGATETVPALWDFPYIGRLPGIDFLNMTPTGWFNFTWLLLVIGCIVIVVRHYRSPLAIIPKSSLAKGQLIFLILLWIMVIGNFEMALTGWNPIRMITEWVIFVNALIATVLVLLLPREDETVIIIEEENYKPIYRRLWIKAVAALLISSVLFFTSIRMIYHYPAYEKLNFKQYQTRFGPEANWRRTPHLKNEKEH